MMPFLVVFLGVTSSWQPCPAGCLMSCQRCERPSLPRPFLPALPAPCPCFFSRCIPHLHYRLFIHFPQHLLFEIRASFSRINAITLCSISLPRGRPDLSKHLIHSCQRRLFLLPFTLASAYCHPLHSFLLLSLFSFLSAVLFISYPFMYFLVVSISSVYGVS